jgi:S-(hydroxymethyl)glutathione dehydrogenase/alcohol dehydrogenase
MGFSVPTPSQRAGWLEELITRRCTLDEVNQGYQDLDDGKLIRGVILHA